MADALASALISTIVTNLSNQALKEFGILTGLNTELDNLSLTFTTVRAVLCDAEVKQWNSGSEGEAVKTWLRLLKDAAYDADDVLDEFDIKVQRRQQQRGLKNHVRSCFSLHHNPIVFRVEMARKLKSAREKLDAIYERRPPGLHVGSISSLQGVSQGVSEWRLTTSLVNDSEICGRVDQKKKLINDLVSRSEALSVHALCGIGGLGKTTLAQWVYNAETIKTHFDLRMWVCVSDDTDIKKLTRAIIESIGGDTDSNERQLDSLDSLQRRLLEKLGGKRFLLVLDDVWEDFPDKWDSSKNAIRSGATGSVVLITTRIPKVAEKMAAVSIRHMEGLSDDDSWSLFALHAFRTGKAEVFMKTIGKCIVKKCGGVPLVLRVLGSLMQLKKQEKEWLDVMESELWDLADEGEKILATLRLSYTHLPMNLRQCFSYCCIYPKDYVMKKEELIRIWMANGFISCGERKGLHERGQEIFSELIERSFFQNVEVDNLENITCKMHDLLHDVATTVMKHELHLIQRGGSLDGAKNCRHVSYFAEAEECGALLKGNSKIPSLRSFFFIMKDGCSINYRKDVVKWLSSQKHLRILRLRLGNETVEKFPMSLSKHLRYLDVSGFSIKRLPKSTSSLHKLQTLNLSNCIYLEQLPKGMKNMKNLVFLHITNCYQLESLPELGPHHNVCSLERLSIHHCRKLQSLPSTGLWCSSSLRHLEIWSCPEFITLSDDGLRHLTALQKLLLSGCPKMTSLPESIQHLTTLVELTIKFCPDLSRRCEKDKGEDWPKIAHIPSIQIPENSEERRRRSRGPNPFEEDEVEEWRARKKEEEEEEKWRRFPDLAKDRSHPYYSHLLKAARRKEEEEEEEEEKWRRFPDLAKDHSYPYYSHLLKADPGGMKRNEEE